MTERKRTPGRRLGGSHHRAVLTDQEVDLARRMSETESGWSVRSLARKFEVSSTHMFHLLRYRRRVS